MTGRSYLEQCDADLGDHRCRFDITSGGFRSDAVLVRSQDRQVLFLSGLNTFADQWFVHGRLTWLSGALAGIGSLVTATKLDSVTGELRVTLFEPLSQDPAPGDAVSLEAGCDKRFATCRAKFGNQLNFRGFPHMPGSERALTYVSDDGDFDGSPLVP